VVICESLADEKPGLERVFDRARVGDTQEPSDLRIRKPSVEVDGGLDATGSGVGVIVDIDLDVLEWPVFALGVEDDHG
jgi:hypothetical protein